MKSITVATFTPPDNFDELELEEKLNLIKIKVQKAYEIIRGTNPLTTIIFVCPENIFKNTKEKQSGAYSKKEMLMAQEEIETIAKSLDNKVLILPGTSRVIKKIEHNVPSVKNTLFGSRDDIRISQQQNYIDAVRYPNALFYGSKDKHKKNNRFTFNGIKFGIEIDYDHKKSLLKKIEQTTTQETTHVQMIFSSNGFQLKPDSYIRDKNLLVIHSGGSLDYQTRVIVFDKEGDRHIIKPIKLEKEGILIYPNVPVPELKSAPSLRAKL